MDWIYLHAAQRLALLEGAGADCRNGGAPELRLAALLWWHCLLFDSRSGHFLVLRTYCRHDLPAAGLFRDAGQTATHTNRFVSGAGGSDPIDYVVRIALLLVDAMARRPQHHRNARHSEGRPAKWYSKAGALWPAAVGACQSPGCALGVQLPPLR